MKDSDFSAKVGERVRILRKAKNLSQESFADLCGLHRTYVGCIERGEKAMTLETLRKITGALGTSLTDFFNHSDFEDHAG